MYLYSKHDRNLRTCSKVYSRIISPSVTITPERYLYSSMTTDQQATPRQWDFHHLGGWIVLCFMKCETETEEQKPWAGKKKEKALCGITVFSLAGECRKWGCNKVKWLIEKTTETSWGMDCAHLRAAGKPGR